MDASRVTIDPPLPHGPRTLVVNADDFGASSLVNRGIIEAHEQGIVTSTSLMVRCRASTEAPACARSHPRLSFGLHIDLGEWIYENGQWQKVYEVVNLDDPHAIGAEVDRQLTIFHNLMGAGPTHLDSHQHVHRDEPARSAVMERAAKLNLPLRHCTPSVQYCGKFYGQSGKGYPYPEGITPAALAAAIRELPDGISEIGCHPGLDSQLRSAYRVERFTEVASLCDPLVKATVAHEGIELRSFKDLPLTTFATL